MSKTGYAKTNSDLPKYGSTVYRAFLLRDGFIASEMLFQGFSLRPVVERPLPGFKNLLLGRSEDGQVLHVNQIGAMRRKTVHSSMIRGWVEEAKSV